MRCGSTPEITAFFHEPTNTAAHLVWDPTTKDAAIVDSVLDYDSAAGRTDTTFADQILAGAAEHGSAAVVLLGEVRSARIRAMVAGTADRLRGHRSVPEVADFLTAYDGTVGAA